MTNCPSEAILRLIGTEAVGEATFARLEGHVEQCPDCQNVLEAAISAVPHPTRLTPARNAPPKLPGLVIERPLGRGGASVVYLAWEPDLKRHVAVKVFPTNALVDPHTREHWLSEARALSRAPHDHVVAIHRVDETEDWLWLVIEYVPGGTLKDRLTEPLPPRDAARLTETIARAVGHFHARGVCHLDLKPSNILLAGEPGAPWEVVSPKISDFGIARLEGEPGTTQTGANGPKGTPSYMAPEQVACLPGTIGPAADLYALGALLYHLLTGRPPFQGASSTETLDQVRNQDPVPPRRLNGRIPRDLETICLTCLEKAPNRRYPSAFTLASDLHLWLDGRPIKARRVSPLGHAWRLCRRHPAVAGLVVTLALTLITGVVGLFVLLSRAETERARLAEARRNAEAYEKFSASAADQLEVILRPRLTNRPGELQERTDAALSELRSAASDLKDRGIVPSSALGILKAAVGSALIHRSKEEEARDPLNEAIADLKQCLAKNPDDKQARFWLLEALYWSGILAEGAGQLEDALNLFEQASAITTAIDPRDSHRAPPARTYKALQRLADRLGQSGRPELERRSRHTNQQLMRYLLGPGTESANDASPPGPETLRRLFERDDLWRISSHEEKEVRDAHEIFVAEWLAISVESLSPFRFCPPSTTDDRDPEAGAAALIAAIRDRCSKLGLADSMVPAATRPFVDDAAGAASLQRRVGRLDEAHATVACLMALAGQLVSEYPNDANSYDVLSHAHQQVTKNAFKTNDDQLIQASLVHAIEAVQRAVAVRPDKTEYQRRLAELTRRLAGIRADRKSAGSAVH